LEFCYFIFKESKRRETYTLNSRILISSVSSDDAHDVKICSSVYICIDKCVSVLLSHTHTYSSRYLVTYNFIFFESECEYTYICIHTNLYRFDLNRTIHYIWEFLDSDLPAYDYSKENNVRNKTRNH